MRKPTTETPATPKHAQAAAQRGRVSQTDVPRHTLPDALRVAKTIEDHYGGSSASPMDIATSLDTTPSSSNFRTITGASVAYGLTDGAYNAQVIKVTALGARAVAPTVQGDDTAALREALVRPRVIKEFLTKYDRKKLPPDNIAHNVLASMGVDKAAAPRTLAVIVAGARHTGQVRQMKGGDWVDLSAGARTGGTDVGQDERGEVEELAADVVNEVEDIRPPEVRGGQPLAPAGPRPIFIAHGKKKVPLQKLEKILTGFKVPYKVATDEPHLGRPIPDKVRDLIKECGSAILIFTRDELLFDKDGKEMWRPSENVVHELGATSFQYDNRIVILMERGLQFPANYESVGRIEFEEDSIEAKTMELMQELIGFGLLRVTPA